MLWGKDFEAFKMFSCGEVEWQDWSTDSKMLVDMRSEEQGTAMEAVKKGNRVSQR